MRIFQRNETDGFLPIVRKVVARPQTTMGRESGIIWGRRFLLRGKKRIKTSRSTSSHQQGEVANKQKRVSNNSHLGEGTISATAILTSPPSHLRSSRSSLTTTATVILTSSPSTSLTISASHFFLFTYDHPAHISASLAFSLASHPSLFVTFVPAHM